MVSSLGRTLAAFVLCHLWWKLVVFRGRSIIV